MPGKTPRTRLGLDSKVITPFYLSVVFHLRVSQDSERTAIVHSTSRESVAAIVRIVEAKIGRRLFDRRCGRGNGKWVPVEGHGWTVLRRRADAA